MKKISRYLLSLAMLTATAGSMNAAVVFSEDFGTLANGTAITISNTSLTYVRIGSQGGSIDALNPSTVGSGASALITGPSGGSLNGIGVASGLDFGTEPTITFSFDFKITNSAGTVVWGIGAGTSFTGNGTFNTSQGLGWFQVTGTNFQRRQGGSWIDVATLTVGTSYNFLATFNVEANTMTVALDGVNQASNVSVTTDDVTPDAFRIYSINGTNIEVDNIQLTAVPEPTAALLGGLGMLVLLRRRR